MSESRIERIKQLINESLQPTTLEVIDDSAAHVGHAGAQTGMGHYTVSIASSQFDGKSMVAKHQLIYAALGDMMKTDIHALRINIVE